MLTRLEALRFGCLRYLEQDLGRHHLLAGPTGSGKSTLIDAVAFLSDLVGLGLQAAIDSRASDVCDLVWMRQRGSFELAIEAEIPQDKALRFPDREHRRVRYEVAVGHDPDTDAAAILSERLLLVPHQTRQDEEPVQGSLFPADREAPETLATQRARGLKTVIHKVPGGNDKFYDETGTGWDHSFKLGPFRSTLGNLPDDDERFPVSSWLKSLLADGVERLAPDCSRIKRPCRPGLPRQLLPDGSNLAWLIADLEQHRPDRLARWADGLKAVLHDLGSVSSSERAEDRHRYLTIALENGLDVPSWLLPDAALRAMVLTLPAALGNAPDILLVEEPEAGQTPSAAAAVYASLKQAAGSQLLVSTQSPSVIRSADPAAVLCLGLTPGGATDIIAGLDHEGLSQWRAGTGGDGLAARPVLG